MYLQVGGRQYTFDRADISPRLLRTSPEERMEYELSPSGYGIHWPLIDEDLAVDALLGGSIVRRSQCCVLSAGHIVGSRSHADKGSLGW